MAGAEGIFLDIFARLNMASFTKVFTEVNRMAKEEGVRTSESFASGFDSMKTQYAGLVRVANDAYRDMELGFRNLQIAEAEINELRARNFKRSTDEMIAAQERMDAALLNSRRLAEEATTAQRTAAMAMPIGRRGGREEEEEDRGGRGGRGSRVTPVPVRGGGLGNALGFGAFAATALGGLEATRESARMQDQLNKLITQSQENRANIPGIEQAILQIANQTGQDPQALAKASMLAERRGYRGGPGGGDLAQMLRVASQLSSLENVNLDEAIKALSITATNFNKTPGQLPDVASQLNRAVGRSGTTLQGYASALPNFETIAGISGLKNEDVWATLSVLTKAGLEPERAGQNEASLIRSLSGQAGAPAQNMLNQLLTEGKAGETAGDIYNKLSERGIGGTIDEIFNKAILPNLTEDQKHVVLPAMFQNLQAQHDIDQGIGGLQTEAAKRFAQSNAEFKGGMLTPFKIRSTGKSGFGSELLAEGATPEDIDKLAQLATKYQQLQGVSNTLKNNQDTVQTIEAVLGKAFSTVEAGRSALIVHEQNQQYKDTLADINAGKAETGPDGQKNVEGTSQAMDTAAAQGRRLKATFHEIAITLGDEMQGPLKNVLGGLADFGDWMVNHKAVLDGFAASITAIATAWIGLKALKMGKSVFGDFADAAKGVNNFFNPPAVGGKGASEIGPINESIQTGAVAGAEKGAPILGEGIVAGAEKAAPVLSGGVSEGANLAAPKLTEGVSAGGKGAAEAIEAGEKSGGAQAGEEIAIKMREAGTVVAGEIGEAGATAGTKFGGMLGPALAPLLGGQMIDDLIQRYNASHHTQAGNVAEPPGSGFWFWHQLQHFADNKPFDIPHFRKGGIAGYHRGTDKVADPYSQPLLAERDYGYDTLLGTVGGQPVGLRGGEGILTPDAVKAVGGKEGIDALNNSPWSNPMHVATTFYGSFAKGVAKYSPYGKYLEASSQTLSDLEKAFEGSTEMHEAGHRGRKGLPSEIEAMLAQGMAPEQIMQALGVSQGKRGGLELPSGRYLSNKDRALLGLPPGKHEGGGSEFFGMGNRSNEATVHSVFSKYFPDSEWPAFHNLEMHEAGFNPQAKNPSGAYGIGQFMPYTWGSYGTTGKTDDLATQADDMMKYIKGRYGSPSAAWGQYFNHPGGEGSYARGGIVGFDRGGQVPAFGPGWDRNQINYHGHFLNRDSDLAANEGSLRLWHNELFGGAYGDYMKYPDPMHGWAPPNAQWWGTSISTPIIGGGVGEGLEHPELGDVGARRGSFSTGGIIGFSGGGLAPKPMDGPGVHEYDPEPWVTMNYYGRNVPGYFYNTYLEQFNERKPLTNAKGGIVGYDAGGIVGHGLLPLNPTPGGGPNPIPNPTPQQGLNNPIAPKDMPGPNTVLPPTAGKTAAPKEATSLQDLMNAGKSDKPARVGESAGHPSIYAPPGDKPGGFSKTEGRDLKQNPSRQGGEDNTSKGWGISGGLIGAAEGAASQAAGMAAAAGTFGGAGGAASSATDLAFQLMNRAIGYGGQLVGILGEGLLETFLPNNSALADPTKNILGKVALGVAGAHPSPQNLAGKSSMQLNPKEDIDAGINAGKQVPMVHMDHPTIHNHTGDHQETGNAILQAAMALPVGGHP